MLQSGTDGLIHPLADVLDCRRAYSASVDAVYFCTCTNAMLMDDKHTHAYVNGSEPL
jgi:hypothetical protein